MDFIAIALYFSDCFLRKYQCLTYIWTIDMGIWPFKDPTNSWKKVEHTHFGHLAWSDTCTRVCVTQLSIIFQLQISLIFPRSVPCPILHWKLNGNQLPMRTLFKLAAILFANTILICVQFTCWMLLAFNNFRLMP